MPDLDEGDITEAQKKVAEAAGIAEQVTRSTVRFWGRGSVTARGIMGIYLYSYSYVCTK